VAKGKEGDKAVDLRVLDAAALIPTRDNPRGKIDTKCESFRELVADVRGKGVQVPCQARPHPTAAGKFELLDGSRRHAACVEVGCQLPVVVHKGLTDAEAFDLCFAANFAREDLTPMQQAAAVRTTLKKCGRDVAAVAAKFGQSEQWVALRARLADLVPKWQVRARAPEWSHFGIGHWVLIARLPEPLQDDLLDDWTVTNETVHQLDLRINDSYLRLLSKAPWPLDDAELVPKAGACSVCPHRSSQQGRLFHDAEPAEQIAAADSCLAPACWKHKALAWLKARHAQLREELKRDVELIVESHPSYEDTQDMGKAGFKDVLGPYAFETCGKAAKDATPALVVHGAGLGQLRWIKPRKAGRSTSTRTAGPTPLKIRQANLEKRRLCAAIDDLLEELKATPATMVLFREAVALAVVFGVSGLEWQDKRDRWKLYAELTADAASETCRAELWTQVQRTLGRNISGQRNGLSGATGHTECSSVRKWCTAAANVIGQDFGELFKKAVAGIPEPKSWKSLKADGTPKTAPAKAKRAK